jgi:hypothetical protein
MNSNLLCLPVNDNFCGGHLAKTMSVVYRTAGGAATPATSQTICSRVTPFLVRFTSDVGEGPLEIVQSGFNLQYLLT